MTIALAVIAGVIAALAIAAAVVQTDRLRDMRDDLRAERRIRAELEYGYRTTDPTPQAPDTTDCLHVWDKWDTPTDTTHGRIQERACSICAETQQRNIGQNLTTPVAEPQPIPATPHPVSSTEIADKYEDHAWTQALASIGRRYTTPSQVYEQIIREYPGDPADIAAAVNRRHYPQYATHHVAESRYK